MPLAALTPETAKWLAAAWLGAVGGAIGSFLNVVVYRLPAGISIVHPGSHCPSCKHPIRWHDNLPVLSWFLLRGRCRDCGAGISRRYPLVEAITAAIFLWLGVAEGLAWGANLPLASAAQFHGAAACPLLSVGQTAAILAYHLLLVSTLLAAALIEYDGHRVPLRLLAPAMVVGGLAPLAWPHLHAVPAWPGLSGWVAGLADGTAGLAAGAVWGLAAEYLQSRRDWGRAAASACVGLFLGWQAALVLGAMLASLALFLTALGRVGPRRRGSLILGCLTTGALLWILHWGALVARWPVLG